ncbi:MAG TPA: hypothetical protein VK673_09840, partial [Chthoniobacterales bacterium]|nr:hypothetical protein [Chthoniobacterales bacterium]
RTTVNHDSALATNAFATVMIKLDRSLSLPDQPIIQEIQHFKDGHIRTNIRYVVVRKLTATRFSLLAPNL